MFFLTIDGDDEDDVSDVVDGPREFGLEKQKVKDGEKYEPDAVDQQEYRQVRIPHFANPCRNKTQVSVQNFCASKKRLLALRC